jgi:hypothetical protein
MPNYIKNRIELTGSKEQVNALIERFSTAYKEEQHKSYDDKNTYNNEGGEYGWLNIATNVFTRRNMADTIGVPDGFKPHMIAAWVRFPDFEKVIPMPKSLHVSSDGWLYPLDNQFASHTEMKQHIDELKAHCAANPARANETIENFIAGIKNYIEYGHATWYGWSVENWGTKWNSSECEKISDTVFDFVTAWSGVPKLIEKMSCEFPDVKISYEYSDEDTGCNCGIGNYLNGEVEFRRLENSSIEAYELAFKLRPDNKEYYQLVDGKYKYVDDETDE